MRLVESIKIQCGMAYNLDYHTQRVNRSRRELFGATDVWDLRDFFQDLPGAYARGLYKCRIYYAKQFEAIEYLPYKKRSIASLRLVSSETVDYSFKYADKSGLEALLAQRGGCDDIIVVKNGLLTDTSSANIAVFDGSRWLTPARPLLAGTRRQALLDQGIIASADITPADLEQCTEIRLFNAMMDWNDAICLPVSAIKAFV